MAALVDRRRLLVIGASGFLGSRLLSSLSRQCDAVGTYCHRRAPALLRLDLRDDHSVRKVLSTIEPDLVIHCGGLTRPDECEREPDAAHAVNVEGTMRLLEHTGAKIIYFSTDYVFDGNRGGYVETESPVPVNVYGSTKLAAERAILAGGPGNVVIRVAGLYGWNPHNNEFLRSLKVSGPLRRAIDCVSSYTLLDDVDRHLPFFLGQSGVFHLVGPNPLSRYEFTRLAASILELAIDVQPTSAAVMYPIARRPPNSSLASSRHALKMADPRTGLLAMKQALCLH